MQSLPTALSTAELNELLAGFPAAASVNRGDGVITVTATHKATGKKMKLLSAISHNGKQWHVMTVPGLVQAS